MADEREAAVARLRGVLAALDVTRGMAHVLDSPDHKLRLAIVSVAPDGRACRLLAQIDQTDDFVGDIARVVGGEEGKLVLKLRLLDVKGADLAEPEGGEARQGADEGGEKAL